MIFRRSKKSSPASKEAELARIEKASAEGGAKYGTHDGLRRLLETCRQGHFESATVTAMKLEAARFTLSLLVFVKEDMGEEWTVSCGEIDRYELRNELIEHLELVAEPAGEDTQQRLKLGSSSIVGRDFVARRTRRMDFEFP